MKYIFTPMLCWLFHASLHAQSCPPTDPAFGQMGRAYGPGTATTRILVQPDQKVIHAGYNQTYTAEPYVFVQRFSDDGKPDPDFGYQGIAIIKSGGKFFECHDVYLQDDGRILLSGPYLDTYDGRVLGVMRLLPDGRPDSSFGTGGMIHYPGIKLYDRFRVSGVDNDGRILLTGSMAGVASLCSYPELMYPVSTALRLKENGKIDSSYGQQGIATVSLGNYSDQGKAGIVLPNGQLILATLSGTKCDCFADYYWGEYWACPESYLKLTRYHTDGSLDSGFAQYDPMVGSPNPLDIVGMFQVNSGKTLAVGSGMNEFILFGFLADGRPDPGFGNNGKVVIDVWSIFSDYAGLVDARVSPDGRILLLGNIDGKNFVLAFKENGALDTSFNSTGIILFELDGRWSYANSLAIQGDNVLVGGHSNAPVLTRLTEDPNKFVPVITANGPLAFCLGDSVRLSTNVSGTHAWYRDGSLVGGIDQSIRATSGGKYRVMVTNAAGCGVSDATAITVYTPPVFYGIQWNGSQMSVDSGYVRYVWYRDNIAVDSTSGFRYNPGTNIGAYTVRVWDKNACASLSSPFNYVVTGIADIRIGDAELRFYPNPVRSGLNIDITQSSGKRMTADIVDLSGRLLQRVVLRQGRNQIPMLPYRAGVYAVVIRYGNEQTVRKVLIVK